MSNSYRPLRVIISGGGTGGHIFPAVSIAGKLKEVCPETEILFVGANGKMEMEKVPAAGYEIVGLPIAGLQRQLTLKNILGDIAVPFKVVASLVKARRLIRKFRPDIAVGVGGYASAPLLYAAQQLRVPTLIQEQNGFAGLTNKILGKKAKSICVAYEGMERFFPADRIVISGNPIRESIKPVSREKGEHLHLLIVGGSLGAGTLNASMRKWIEAGCPGGEDVEVLWQCGRYYKASTDEFMKEAEEKGLLKAASIRHTDFIAGIDKEFAKADLVISRAGASTVSELCCMNKAVIFVPSPNVAEDHQTHNAMALVRKDAAVLVKDVEAREKLMDTAMDLIHQSERIAQMEKNIAALALPQASQTIVDEVYRVADGL